MKTYLKFGAGVTLAGFVLNVLCYVFGFWEAANMGTGMVIGIVGGITIFTVGIVLGTKESRAPSGPQGFSYGQAFKAGLLVAVFAAVTAPVTNFVFFKFINPNYAENTITWTKSFMEKLGAPDSAVEKAEADIRAKSTMTRQLLNGVMGAVVMGGIISLITAAIMKRPPSEDFSEIPPPVG